MIHAINLIHKGYESYQRWASQRHYLSYEDLHILTYPGHEHVMGLSQDETFYSVSFAKYSLEDVSGITTMNTAYEYLIQAENLLTRIALFFGKNITRTCFL